MNNLAQALHTSHFVFYDEDMELVFDWNGAHTVNIYDIAGEPLDCFTWGHDRNDITVDEARDHIVDHIAEMKAE